MSSKVHTVRLPPVDAERVDQLVERGSFQSRSDFLRYAVKSALQEIVRREAEAELLFGPEEDLEIGSLLDGPGEVPASSDESPAPRRERRGRRNTSGT